VGEYRRDDYEDVGGGKGDEHTVEGFPTLHEAGVSLGLALHREPHHAVFARRVEAVATGGDGYRHTAGLDAVAEGGDVGRCGEWNRRVGDVVLDVLRARRSGGADTDGAAVGGGDDVAAVLVAGDGAEAASVGLEGCFAHGN